MIAELITEAQRIIAEMNRGAGQAFEQGAHLAAGDNPNRRHSGFYGAMRRKGRASSRYGPSAPLA